MLKNVLRITYCKNQLFILLLLLSFIGLSFSIMGIVRKNVKHRGLAITGDIFNFLGAGAISVFIIYVCIAAFI